jgi:hypothetical protein
MGNDVSVLLNGTHFAVYGSDFLRSGLRTATSVVSVFGQGIICCICRMKSLQG